MADIKINYTAGVDSDFTGNVGASLNAGISPKERITEIFDRINSNLGAPYYTSKVLKEYQDEILQIMETLEKKAVTSEILNRDITQSEFLDKTEKMIEEKAPESKTVWLVLQDTDQSNYSEGRYYSPAKDATEIVGVYDNEDAAQDIAVKLERLEVERQSLDDYDEECDGHLYYRVVPMEVQHEPDFQKTLLGDEDIER